MSIAHHLNAIKQYYAKLIKINSRQSTVNNTTIKNSRIQQNIENPNANMKLSNCLLLLISVAIVGQLFWTRQHLRYNNT